MTDPQWAEEALRKWREEKSREALGELLKAQRDRAWSLAVRLVGSPEDAEDAVQEAFVKLLSRETGFANLAEFDVTVYRAVYQCSMDALRRGGRRARREAAAAEEAVAAAPAGRQMEAEMSANEASELRVKLRAAVQELPEETRSPAVLCYYQGLSEVQAAEVLDVPRSTLRRRLSRAVSDLRRRLGRDGQRLGVGVLVGLLAGEGALSAPGSLCAALDRLLPGRPCAQVPPLSVPSGLPVLPAAAGAVKAAAGLVAAAACAAVVVLGAWALGLGGIRERVDVGGHQAAADVRPGDGQGAVPVPMDREKEEEMRRKLGGLAVLASGLVLSGIAGAGEPNAEVGAVITKIQARQVAKAEAAAKDNAERAEMYKKYSEQYGQGRYGQ